jgi:formylglycine-generating enzyme required for sulfatase activity
MLVVPAGIPPRISAQDGTVLRLIPGGGFYVPEGFDEYGPRKVQIQPFYMDETPITNQQFVNFLNQIRSDINIEDGAVKKGKKIYLYLGEALHGYEPIIYRKAVFRIKNSSHSACPVLRVTAYGAQAYASFNHERLPTALEWLYAASEGNIENSPGGLEKIIMPESFFKSVKLPYPVMLFEPNFFGIKGMNINLGSWVQDRVSTYIKGRRNNFAILGGIEKGTVSKTPVPLPIRRNSWEAFEEVGFRCVKHISTDSK